MPEPSNATSQTGPRGVRDRRPSEKVAQLGENHDCAAGFNDCHVLLVFSQLN